MFYRFFSAANMFFLVVFNCCRRRDLVNAPQHPPRSPMLAHARARPAHGHARSAPSARTIHHAGQLPSHTPMRSRPHAHARQPHAPARPGPCASTLASTTRTHASPTASAQHHAHRQPSRTPAHSLAHARSPVHAHARPGPMHPLAQGSCARPPAQSPVPTTTRVASPHAQASIRSTCPLSCARSRHRPTRTPVHARTLTSPELACQSRAAPHTRTLAQAPPVLAHARFRPARAASPHALSRPALHAHARQALRAPSPMHPRGHSP